MIYKGWAIMYEDGMPVIVDRESTDTGDLYLKREHAEVSLKLGRAHVLDRLDMEARNRFLLWEHIITIMDERGHEV